MGRRIVTRQLESSKGQEIDSYSDKLIKYIPSEIVAAWIAVTGIVEGAADIPATTVLWILLVIFTIITAFWIAKQTSEQGKPPAKTQITISTGAFLVWSFALGEPFSSLSFYNPAYGSILLVVYTLVIALVNPTE